MEQERYAITIKREKQNDYFIIMPLEEIDKCFIKYKKSGVLSLMKENDSVIKENDIQSLSIKKVNNHSLKEDKNLPIIEDEFYLTFPIDILFLKKPKLANILYNRLQPYLHKNITDTFKEKIELLKQNPKLFVSLFPALSYEEQRLIRTLITKSIHVEEYIKKEPVEVLEIKEEKETGISLKKEKI